jgi:hypothetical protein
LSIDKLVNVGHEVGDGMGVSFVDLFKELDVGYPLLVVGYDIVTPDFRRETRCISYVCQDLVPHI